MLGIKQKAFVEEYLKIGNATQAYKTIYECTSDEVAGAAASRLLGKVKVTEYMNELNKETTNKNVADILEVKELYTRILRDHAASAADRILAADKLSRVAFVSELDRQKLRIADKKLEFEKEKIKKDEAFENKIEIIMDKQLQEWGS